MAVDIIARALAIKAGSGSGGGGSKVKLGSITLSTTWTGSVSPYTQIVTVSGATVTENSKVDLQFTSDQLHNLVADGVLELALNNEDGVLTVYCEGQKPTSQMVIQCTVTETEGE